MLKISNIINFFLLFRRKEHCSLISRNKRIIELRGYTNTSPTRRNTHSSSIHLTTNRSKYNEISYTITLSIDAVLLYCKYNFICTCFIIIGHKQFFVFRMQRITLSLNFFTNLSTFIVFGSTDINFSIQIQFS